MKSHPANLFVDYRLQKPTSLSREEEGFFDFFKSLLKLLSLPIEVLVNNGFGQFYINPFISLFSIVTQIFSAQNLSATALVFGALIYLFWGEAIYWAPVAALLVIMMVVHTLIDFFRRSRGVKIDNQSMGVPTLYSVTGVQGLLNKWFVFVLHPLLWVLIAALAYVQLGKLALPYLICTSAFLLRNLIIGISNYLFVEQVMDEEARAANIAKELEELKASFKHGRVSEKSNEEEVLE